MQKVHRLEFLGVDLIIGLEYIGIFGLRTSAKFAWVGRGF